LVGEICINEAFSALLVGMSCLKNHTHPCLVKHFSSGFIKFPYGNAECSLYLKQETPSPLIRYDKS